MPNGYTGKIIRVDLSAKTISVEEPEEDFYRSYVGGRGLISYFLHREVKAGADPLGPDNKLIFATGVLTGVPIAGSGRHSVGAKSPLTNGYGDAEAGGYWGAELKHAGYDAIIVEGKSDTPVYLWIEDGKAEIKNASHLWGKTIGECQSIIRQELGDKSIRVAQIGIAGENQVRYACVINDLSHAAGRAGIGAVMGSKNLKAVAVRGHQKVALANPGAVTSIIKWFNEDLKTNRGALNMSENGTPAILTSFNMIGALPTRNFREGVFEGADKISGQAMKESILVSKHGCYACPIRCKQTVAVGEPYNVDSAYGGPEYETLGSFGSNCGIDNLKAIAKANELCNAYGLDTISAGDTIAFAMECFEQGILTEKDTGGLKLNFGDAEVMLQLVEMIARREGLGKILAEDMITAAREIGNGAEEYAMHVKGQGIPMHEPRLKPGAGVGYAISPTGADHNHSMHDTGYARRIGGVIRALGVSETVPAQDLNPAKIRILVYNSLWQHTKNCFVWCDFVPLGMDKMIELINGITGWNTNTWELMKVGERCITLAQAFNVREGKTKAADSLPRRFFTPYTSGPMKGVSVNEEDFRQAVDTYYAMVGWDRESGVPALAKLQELGIEWAAGV